MNFGCFVHSFSLLRRRKRLYIYSLSFTFSWEFIFYLIEDASLFLLNRFRSISIFTNRFLRIKTIEIKYPSFLVFLLLFLLFLTIYWEPNRKRENKSNLLETKSNKKGQHCNETAYLLWPTIFKLHNIS